MDESMQTYLDHQRTKLFHDCKYRAKNETWLNRAYAMMLVDQGFLSKEEYRTIDKGLVQGGGKLTDGSPNYMWEDVLTREQFVTVLYRLLEKTGLL